MWICPFVLLASTGMSFFPTRKRKWPGFCERKRKTRNGEEVEYYYRLVVCNLLNTPIELPLDPEPIRAGENEVAAAKRLGERLCDHDTRFFDAGVTDAFYMEGPFVNFCVAKGKDVIIVLKDNYPSLIEDAKGCLTKWNRGFGLSMTEPYTSGTSKVLRRILLMCPCENAPRSGRTINSP